MYFRRYDDDAKHIERMKNLFEKFKELNMLSKVFRLQDVEEILRKKYLANEIVNDRTYLGLIDDPMVDVRNIFKLYEISDSNVLNNLYTDYEIESQIEFASHESIILNESDLQSTNINLGKLIRIALETRDNNILSGYTQQGESIKVAAELFVLAAKVSEEDVNLKDEWFQEYLEALVWAGYISNID